jgi:protein-S-isoprenylcysteine O-methyltransferase Ste14
MQTLKTIFIGLFLINILPLLFDYELITHWKNMAMVVANIILWAYHPKIYGTEEKTDTDKKTYFLILSAVFASMVLTVLQWAYFSPDKEGIALYNYIGLAMLFGGVFFRNYSIYILGKQFTSKVQITDNHELITAGPYRVLRHPSYTGAYMAMLGTCILLQSWAMLLVTTVAVFYAYYKRIEAEEATLLGHFGENYAVYQANSKRMFPAVW